MFMAFSRIALWLASGVRKIPYIYGSFLTTTISRLLRNDRDMRYLNLVAFSDVKRRAGVGDAATLNFRYEDGTCTMTLKGLDEDEAGMAV
jgi:hypothetical protein